MHPPERYWDPTQSMWAVKLLPGQYYASNQPEVIVTVLGSCISACIRDPYLKLGGMNHFMLPQEGGPSSWSGWAARYGSNAMELLINELLCHGAQRSRLEVKLFGGGKVLAQLADVGARNIQFALGYCQREHLPLVGQDLGGTHPRKVRYFPDTGKVQMKYVGTMRNNLLVEREQTYVASLKQDTEKVGTVELF